MTARSPSAFALSALLHGGVAAIVFIWMLTLPAQESKQPVVFDLVAGEGHNYGATVAPALGSSDGKTDKTPDFAKTIRRIEQRKINKAEAEIKAQREAELKAEREAEVKAAREAAAQHLSKAEFDRLHGKTTATTARPTTQRSAAVPRIDSPGIAGGVKGGSTANKTGGAGGTALTREEMGYAAILNQALKNAFARLKPSGLGDDLEAIVEVHILPDGTLTDARILKSSGNDDFDRAALAAIDEVKTIGARPEDLPEVQQIPFQNLAQ